MPRYVSIWFPDLISDWFIRRRPELKDTAFVIAAPEKGRVVIKAASRPAQAQGIHAGMVAADCRAVLPALQVIDDIPGTAEKLLNALAEWCLRYSPIAAADLPEGLILDSSGCAHLWGGEQAYLADILGKLKAFGYHVRAAMADTIGAAWAVARFGKLKAIIEPGHQSAALLPLPPAALRLDPLITVRLEKLGLYTIGSFINMPRSALRRRFGMPLLSRLEQALGQYPEVIDPIKPIAPYQERLPVLEPIKTATAITIALKQLLDQLCCRLAKEGMGLRNCTFKAYRIDGNIQQIQIGTSRAANHAAHLFKLFEIKIATLEPALGFELFMVEAAKVEAMSAAQDALWNTLNQNNAEVAELLDRLAGKVGIHSIRRYLPQEHHWPERSVKPAADFDEKPATSWPENLPRPVHLLPKPETIEVTVPLPDYPPILFRYKAKVFNISKADGPERIEQEWWIEDGLYRDYYCVEDDTGGRYWLFRLGHYNDDDSEWFIHGFFA